MCTQVPDIFINKQWLVNDVNKIVDDALTGLVRCNPQLALLDCGRVVVRRDHLVLDKVKIISGGASGHEPAFAGFVGQGMLTASVQGGIYSSPPPNLVLRAIKELSRRHDKGILIIIGDNMGDRLSFGLAVERAKNIPNVKVKLIQVADDCNKTFERRGLTGSVLIQKIAGAMSDADFFLFDIYIFCKALLDNLATVMVSLKPAVSPYLEISTCTRLVTKEIEFGSGFHGQPGYLQSRLLSSHEAVELMLNHITDPSMIGKLTLDPTVPVILLINNLGNSSKLEELIFINETVTQLQAKNIIIERIYTSSFLTSLEMCGLSLTILNKINPEILIYLDAPSDAPFWKSFTQIALSPETSLIINTDIPPKETQLKPNRGPVISEKTVKMLENIINFACGALISCEKQLNLIDSESGDADTGTNLKVSAHKINEYLAKGKLKIQWPFMLFEQISKILEHGHGGLLACFYSIMFEAASQPMFLMAENDPLTVELWSQALDSTCKAVQSYGGITVGRNTMYDALYAANTALQEGLASKMGPMDAVGLAAVAAEDAAVNTRRPEAKHPDPGAHAVGIWMRAIYETLKLHSDVLQ